MIRFMMMLGCVFIMFSAANAQAETPLAQSRSFVVSGVLLNQGNNPLMSRFSQWLAKHSGLRLSTRYADSYQSLSDQLRQQPNALAWTCGAPFVEDHVANGQQLVAVPLFKGAPVYHSLVITRRGRQEKSLADFKGQGFAYADPRSNSGYIAPAYALKKNGIDIKTYFRYRMHTGLHEYAIEAVLFGLADVANIDEYVLVEYFKTHPDANKRLAIIERFGPYPFTPIVAAKGVPKETIVRLQRALLGMRENKEGAEILAHFGLDGFVTKDASFYEPIATMLRELNP